MVSAAVSPTARVTAVYAGAGPSRVPAPAALTPLQRDRARTQWGAPASGDRRRTPSVAPLRPGPTNRR